MKSNCVLGTIRAEDGEHIAFPKASRMQACRHAPHCVFQLIEGDPASSWTVDERYLFSDFIGRCEDEVGERDFRYRDIGIWGAKDHGLESHRLPSVSTNETRTEVLHERALSVHDY